MPKESVAENECVAWCKSQGGLALKLKNDGERGFPDRTLMFPGALVLFVEMKTEIGHTSPQQDIWIARLRGLGFVCEVCRTLGECQLAVMKARITRRESDDAATYY